MSAEHPEASSARRHALLAIKIAVSIVLLVLLFSKIEIGQLWAIARRASVLWLGVALAIYGVNLIASTWRWFILLDAQEVEVRRRWLFGSFIVACFFNNFLPSNIGGHGVRLRRH